MNSSLKRWVQAQEGGIGPGRVDLGVETHSFLVKDVKRTMVQSYLNHSQCIENLVGARLSGEESTFSAHTTQRGAKLQLQVLPETRVCSTHKFKLHLCRQPTTSSSTPTAHTYSAYKPRPKTQQMQGDSTRNKSLSVLA